MNKKIVGLVSSLLIIACLFGSACSKTYAPLPHVFRDMVSLGSQDAPSVDITLETTIPESVSRIAIYEVYSPCCQKQLCLRSS